MLRLLRAWHAAPRTARALVPLVGMAVLWWSSSRVPEDGPVAAAYVLLHNLAHVVAYAVLASAFWLAWSRRAEPRDPGPGLGARSLGAWLSATVYGGVDELHQSFVPGRDCSLLDLCSDAMGGLFAVLVLRGLVVEGRPRNLAWLALGAGLLSSAVASFA